MKIPAGTSDERLPITARKLGRRTAPRIVSLAGLVAWIWTAGYLVNGTGDPAAVAVSVVVATVLTVVGAAWQDSL